MNENPASRKLNETGFTRKLSADVGISTIYTDPCQTLILSLKWLIRIVCYRPKRVGITPHATSLYYVISDLDPENEPKANYIRASNDVSIIL